MKIKRLFTAAASVATAAVFGCALFFSCGNPAERESLRWRTAIDIPVNQSFPVPILEGVNVIIDLGLDDVPVGSDVIDFLKKFTNHEAGYHLSVTNKTGVDLTLYALLFRGDDDDAKNMEPMEFYNLLTGTPPESLATQSLVSLLGQKGLLTPANGGTESYSMPVSLSDTLCSLVLTSKSLMWRWLAHISSGDTDSLNVADSSIIHARLRLRISIENSFDSLLAM